MKLNKKGFSLVELLAAIVILAIMITLATVAYSRYRQHAKQQGYDTLAKTASEAAAQYAMDNPEKVKVKGGVSFETLYEGEYMSSLSDPGIKNKQCKGDVVLRTMKEETVGSLDTNEYTVHVCCKNYNYTYVFPGGSKTKTKECAMLQ